MPRSFLVKKYFPYKKQHNRESYPESHTGKFAIVRDCMQDICECIRHIGNHSQVMSSPSSYLQTHNSHVADVIRCIPVM